MLLVVAHKQLMKTLHSPVSKLLSFREDLSLIQTSEENLVLTWATGSLNFKQLPKAIRAVLDILKDGGTTEEQLGDIVLENNGFAQLHDLYYCLEEFKNLGLICQEIVVDGLSLATVVPLSPGTKLQLPELEQQTKYVISRFAYCHRDKGQMILESPLSTVQLIVTNWQGIAIWAALMQPLDSQEIAAKITEMTVSRVELFLKILLVAGMIAPFPEQENEALVQWEFHDLLFHGKTRIGRQLNPVGKSYGFREQSKPLPVVKSRNFEEYISLYKPDIRELGERDYPFSLVLEERKSLRNQGDKPITAKQLGEFLYRCARVRDIFTKDNRQLSDRPYPSGGACYELELYPAVHACEGLSPGFYHYCPQEHQLGKISHQNSYVEKLLQDTQLATGMKSYPQVLLVIAARFSRVTRVYESIAYNLILKHVGVLYQTMYLVATTMELAPCALGAGNSHLFAAAAGTDYYAESSVGEFILGSRAS